MFDSNFFRSILSHSSSPRSSFFSSMTSKSIISFFLTFEFFVFRIRSISIFSIKSEIDRKISSLSKSFSQASIKQSTIHQSINQSINSISVITNQTMTNNNYQNNDFNQQQFNFLQIMIRKAVTAADIDFFDFSNSSKPQNTPASVNDNNVFNDR